MVEAIVFLRRAAWREAPGAGAEGETCRLVQEGPQRQGGRALTRLPGHSAVLPGECACSPGRRAAHR